MMIVSPFPPEFASALHRWLNAPRDPNFDIDQASDLETVTAMLAAKTAAGDTFALKINNLTAGFIGFEPTSPTAGHFAGMVIAPEYRGLGYGLRFLQIVVSELRALGYRTLTAAVRADNRRIQATFENAGADLTAKIYTFSGSE
jgi:ribosomal protein S18 acetylase RimI-like enzyme